MPSHFDSAAAQRFLEHDDRDEAWFFAGREVECEAFAAAARQTYDSTNDNLRPRAVLRIFQGAPGCGKTSFVRRMESERRDLLFVLVDEQHLTDANALTQRIAQEALDQRRGANILSCLAVPALEASRMKTAAEALLRGAGDRAAKQAGLVIWLDEAQTVDKSCKALASAHKGALGVPALVVLSGLPTNARRVRSIPGLHQSAEAAKAFLDDMVRHGILIRRRSPADVTLDRWSVAVPSMAAWAEVAKRKAAGESQREGLVFSA